jgi:hypothetical protein
MYSRRRPETQLFLLWSKARHAEERILGDITSHFTVLEMIEIAWSRGETFSRNLTRMYGDALPPGSDKEVHCGDGPMLAVVVRDERPRYRIRRTNRGPKWTNSNVFDARSRYREWTGGGHRVHASDSVTEAERNLVFLLGRPTDDFPSSTSSDGVAHGRAGDPIGTHNWVSTDELLVALGAHGCALVSRSEGPDGSTLTVRTPDAWWAEHIAAGTPVGDRMLEVPVGTGSVRLTLVEVPPRPTWDWVGTLRPWVRRARRLLSALRPSGRRGR